MRSGRLSDRAACGGARCRSVRGPAAVLGLLDRRGRACRPVPVACRPGLGCDRRTGRRAAARHRACGRHGHRQSGQPPGRRSRHRRVSWPGSTGKGSAVCRTVAAASLALAGQAMAPGAGHRQPAEIERGRTSPRVAAHEVLGGSDHVSTLRSEIPILRRIRAYCSGIVAIGRGKTSAAHGLPPRCHRPTLLADISVSRPFRRPTSPRPASVTHAVRS